MGKQYNQITNEQVNFIKNQHIFFVGTAAKTGNVNISPKGMDSLRIIDKNTVIWLNLTGSGNETSAHVQINSRMTLMFCAFEGTPHILRLYGKAEVLHQADIQWKNYISLFPELPGSRQIFILNIAMTQSSCGMAVPFYEFKEERLALVKSSDRKGQKGIEKYWEQKNQKSIDGFNTNIIERSELNEA